ncbi:putative haloacid dehalogenase-like hydrolase protein [Polaribacter irgensii 23-P]|uniref:Putative haloacid dehalogenase-like hydrolase protein n=1 Tax=Polaribacter irgensii 23-P TaxID=313594 RepID=A4C282_9FLAO|nr:YjjG family noncanonical pyrimidine nucleotidase [Polaribacter irgensii]EAR11683.1 putative haloacid dehalogenase-like hydrolase protein [Polaribacter irgensii 23-P]
MPMKIEHIFFDLDHTLWDFEKNSALTFNKIFLENKINLEIDDFLKVYVPLNLKYWKLYRNEKISKEDLRYERLKKSFDAISYGVSDAMIDKLATEYMDNLSSFNHLFEGAIELLDYLKEKYTLHIITNGFEEIQSKKMINSKLYPYFEQIITSESVGVKKPDSRVFNFALKVSKATKENSIMIGDSLEADIHGALRVGMQAIHCVFDEATPTDKSITTVTSLLEIKRYL